MAERGPRGVGTMARTGRVQATISFRVGGVERASASLYRNISVTQRPRLESGLAPRNINLTPNKLRVNSFGSSIDQSPPKSTFSRPGVENRFSRVPFVEIGDKPSPVGKSVEQTKAQVTARNPVKPSPEPSDVRNSQVTYEPFRVTPGTEFSGDTQGNLSSQSLKSLLRQPAYTGRAERPPTIPGKRDASVQIVPFREMRPLTPINPAERAPKIKRVAAPVQLELPEQPTVVAVRRESSFSNTQRLAEVRAQIRQEQIGQQQEAPTRVATAIPSGVVEFKPVVVSHQEAVQGKLLDSSPNEAKHQTSGAKAKNKLIGLVANRIGISTKLEKDGVAGNQDTVQSQSENVPSRFGKMWFFRNNAWHETSYDAVLLWLHIQKTEKKKLSFVYLKDRILKRKTDEAKPQEELPSVSLKQELMTPTPGLQPKVVATQASEFQLSALVTKVEASQKVSAGLDTGQQKAAAMKPSAISTPNGTPEQPPQNGSERAPAGVLEVVIITKKQLPGGEIHHVVDPKAQAARAEQIIKGAANVEPTPDAGGLVTGATVIAITEPQNSNTASGLLKQEGMVGVDKDNPLDGSDVEWRADVSTLPAMSRTELITAALLFIRNKPAVLQSNNGKLVTDTDVHRVLRGANKKKLALAT